mmetsp:Transcript_20741/g.48175  ORF Transcript_20741/g.48175 Transcript_20741/m.48175 type:complete len:103 (-) Transcript_20741:267-575(-)|eukprot:CAMPEP_0178388752 /NCGR_PEP_ID=MMETSP0689_2-20121128/9756_1 /TAXON_ID=160604 /ORGANISM="Amphidinium massartii, Strain CS-259" /LENGTH=102 /DNA_ID=CAMNT_0020009167 /DNA_START=32 /DNA_END=340 /DNA_ORIENTATION=-
MSHILFQRALASAGVDVQQRRRKHFRLGEDWCAAGGSWEVEQSYAALDSPSMAAGSSNKNGQQAQQFFIGNSDGDAKDAAANSDTSDISKIYEEGLSVKRDP